MPFMLQNWLYETRSLIYYHDKSNLPVSVAAYRLFIFFYKLKFVVLENSNLGNKYFKKPLFIIFVRI